MDFDRAIEYALEGRAVLFNGAGFSTLAKNLKNENLGDAREFSKNLCNMMSIKENDNLSDVSNYYLKNNSPIELIRKLQDEFTCRSLDEPIDGVDRDIYTTIAGIDWMGVYTTNYDNVFEYACTQIGKRSTSVTLSDDPKNYSKQNLVVHINGYINKLTPEKLTNEFKLTQASYNTEDFVKSSWKGHFVNKLKSAKAVFFIGTSLNYDLDIRRIIHGHPQWKSKIFFIDREKPVVERDIFDMRGEYGEVKYIGMDKFVDKIREIESSYDIESREIEFDSFSKMNPSAYSHKVITNQEYWDLLIRGKVDDEIAYSKLEDDEYLFSRTCSSKVEEFIKSKEKKLLVIHSDLGNGKSIFLNKISLEHCRGNEIFIFNKMTDSFFEEVHNIENEFSAPIIIVENYYDRWTVIDSLVNMTESGAKFIFTGRTFIHENRLNELVERLGIKEESVCECDLNHLDDGEIVKLVKVLNKADLFESSEYNTLTKKKNYVKKNLKSKLCNVMLDVVKSSKVRDRLDKEFDVISENESMKGILTAICINSILDIGMSANEIVEYLEIDSFNHLMRINDNVRTLINWEENKIEFKSSILARYFMDTKINKSSIQKNIKQMAIYANKNNYDDLSELVSRKLISVSNLQLLTRGSGIDFKCVIEIFDELKEFELYRERPFFWLQYAIACLDCRIFDRAEHYLDIAYKKSVEYDKKAFRGDKFDTFQIDTQRGRFILEKMICEGKNIEFIREVKQSKELFKKSLSSQYQNDNYVNKQFALYNKVWNVHRKNLSFDEKKEFSSIIKEIKDMQDNMKNDDENMKSLYSDIIRSVANK